MNRLVEFRDNRRNAKVVDCKMIFLIKRMKHTNKFDKFEKNVLIPSPSLPPSSAKS